MARRSSARLRNQTPSTPKRVSLAHDASLRAPRTAPSKLFALQESEEMPGAFPRSESPPERPTATPSSRPTMKVPVNFDDATPENAKRLQPAQEEMHPQQHHQSTAKVHDEARWLGFTDMVPHTEPAPRSRTAPNSVQDTPTKAPKSEKGVTSPKFEFTFRREQSLELSPAAKKLMNEKREEATKIREQMMAAGDQHESVTQAVARKIATPKGTKGRFSDAHKQQFQKMDSIAGHASSYRANGNPPSRMPMALGTPEKSAHIQGLPTKSLKRSPSKAELDSPGSALPRLLPRSASKPTLLHSSRSTPQSSSAKLASHASDATPSPVKRVKRDVADTSSTKQVAAFAPSGREEAATPRRTPGLIKQPSYPDLSSLVSPTQASLARTTAATKIPAPHFIHSPTKPAIKEMPVASCGSPKPSTPLLARSPIKAVKTHATSNAPEESKPMLSPLLLRSPSRAPMLKKADPDKDQEASPSSPKKAPLLSRSPLKMSFIKKTDTIETTEKQKPTPSVPLLARSPLKMSIASNNAVDQAAATPDKSATSNLMNRLKLLRASPVKSILRTPQRLYSNDPAKVAAGTHLATPPKYVAPRQETPVAADCAVTTPLRKRVDFSSSTKARYERAQSEQASTPPKETTPVAQTEPRVKSTFADYPSLPETLAEAGTPQKRRQTIAPGDFTFRADSHGIVFGTSPSASRSALHTSPAATIRHVSAEADIRLAASAKKRKFEFENKEATLKADTTRAPPLPPLAGSKKRKFDFENQAAQEDVIDVEASDKENGDHDEQRPAKRVKPTAPTPSPIKKRTTLGVKPKGAPSKPATTQKKTNTISQARLNALAQPKRRA